MTISTINSSEEHSQHIGRVYQEYYARLRRYFLAQLGNASEVDDCVQETIRRFFFFMEDRCWETDAEHIPVYLMRIAGFLCSRRLAAKRVRRGDDAGREHSGLFDKLKAEAARTVGELTEFTQLFLRPAGDSPASQG